MSEEAFRMVQDMDMDELRTRIAVHCAPLLAGVKMSNLLTVSGEQKKSIRNIFAHTDISCHVLWESEDKVTFLLYIRCWMDGYFNRGDVKILMEKLGYQGMSRIQILERVKERYTAHMEQQGPFPHEIGLLLGYPPEDVEGFMKHQGKNFLCAGYWKVYGNPAEAIRTFRAYDRAQAAVMAMVRQGSNIQEVLNVCRSRQFQ